MPCLAIQGLDDKYGTLAQCQAIREQAGGAVAVLALENCGHTPHFEQHDTVLDRMQRFVAELA